MVADVAGDVLRAVDRQALFGTVAARPAGLLRHNQAFHATRAEARSEGPPRPSAVPERSAARRAGRDATDALLLFVRQARASLARGRVPPDGTTRRALSATWARP